MKKLIIPLAIMGSVGFIGSAAAVDASQVFTWTGTVPALPTANSWVISQADGTAITNGILTFKTNASGKGELTGSTELRFTIFKEQTGVGNEGKPDTTQPATTYKYTMTSLAINSAGLAAEQDPASGYFAIQATSKGATAVNLVKNTAQTASTGGETILTVVKSSVATPNNQPNAGDSVDIQASIVISDSV